MLEATIPSDSRPARMYITLTRTEHPGRGERYNLSHQVLLKEVTMPRNENGSVAVGVAQTINLGNYESLRIDVTVEVPATKETAATEIDWAKELAVQKLAEYKAEALGEGVTEAS